MGGQASAQTRNCRLGPVYDAVHSFFFVPTMQSSLVLISRKVPVFGSVPLSFSSRSSLYPGTRFSAHTLNIFGFGNKVPSITNRPQLLSGHLVSQFLRNTLIPGVDRLKCLLKVPCAEPRPLTCLSFPAFNSMPEPLSRNYALGGAPEPSRASGFCAERTRAPARSVAALTWLSKHGQWSLPLGDHNPSISDKDQAWGQAIAVEPPTRVNLALGQLRPVKVKASVSNSRGKPGVLQSC